MANLQTLTREALSLPPEDRASLAHQLRESIEPFPGATSDPVHLARQRDREMDDDPEGTSLSHEDVMEAATKAFR